MQTINENLLDIDNLSPKLLKIKADLEHELEAGLDTIDARKDWTWVQKQKASTDLKQTYEDSWLSHLTDAGIIVSPMFESVENEKEEAEKTLYEEFKLYESLWD